MDTKKIKFSVRTIEELTEELNKILSNNSEYKLDKLEIDYYPPNKTYYIYIAHLSYIEDIEEMPIVAFKMDKERMDKYRERALEQAQKLLNEIEEK